MKEERFVCLFCCTVSSSCSSCEFTETSSRTVAAPACTPVYRAPASLEGGAASPLEVDSCWVERCPRARRPGCRPRAGPRALPRGGPRDDHSDWAVTGAAAVAVAVVVLLIAAG